MIHIFLHFASMQEDYIKHCENMLKVQKDKIMK